MNFFEGQYKSKPNINLSGSNRSKTKEDLIREARIEREKRETEKKQLKSSKKIQSVYRSYLARKRIKEKFRNDFDQLVVENRNVQFNHQNIRHLLNMFNFFYYKNTDNERLLKITNLVIKYKDLIRNSNGEQRSFDFTLTRFLVIQLKCLNQNDTKINQSAIIRIIEYFTDPSANSTTNNENLNLIFSYLVKNNYINELAIFSISKIPASPQYVTSIPIADSIAQLFSRCFVYLNTNQDQYSAGIVRAITNQLFIKAYIPQIQCVMNSLSKILSMNENMLKKLFDFLKIYSRLFENEQNEQQTNQNTNTNFNFRLSNDININNNNNLIVDDIKFSLLKLFSILKMFSGLIQRLNNDQFYDLLKIIKSLLLRIPTLNIENFLELISDNDEDEPMNESDNTSTNSTIKINKSIIDEIKNKLDSKEIANKINSNLNHMDQTAETSLQLKEFCISVSYIPYFIIYNANTKIHQSFLIRKLSFERSYLKHLWSSIGSLSIKPQPNQEIFLLQLLASGTCPDIYYNHLFKLVAPLCTFCSLYNLFLIPILDKEFLEGEAIFSKMDLIKISSYLKDVSIGSVEFMHPDVNTNQRNYSDGVNTPLPSRQRTISEQPVSNEIMIKAKCFTDLFLTCTNLVQRMHRRDIRFGFCPEDHWISTSKYVVSNRLTHILRSQDPTLLTQVRFGQASYLFQNSEMETDNRLTLNDIRSLTILQELPFTIPFNERVEVLETFILNEPIYVHENAQKIRIRRDHLYEDAFEKLSLQNVPDLKSATIRVEMINQLGLDEAGIDGGGVYREFMLKLLEMSFDPNLGFFILTSDGFLYPNPNVSYLYPEFEEHYIFLGRIIGKAIQTKLLSPLKFAGFFLQKLIISENRLIDIDYLASLDPEMCKNVLYLKDCKDDVKDLALNFAINVNQLGQTELIELKPGGKDIPVTNDNKIEYIYLLADYKLNKQIHEQTIAFRKGISSVINIDLLKLFNTNEIQNLISGSVETIDVEDWKRNTVYSGGYSPESRAIEIFWLVVENFDEEKKRKLLKFATSRSRPPLFGFKNLIPNFAIQNSGNADRLPTSSTCLNLLKLPPIEDFEILKEKLICAIESESGFDLS